jgi:hypothetical protein
LVKGEEIKNRQEEKEPHKPVGESTWLMTPSWHIVTRKRRERRVWKH